MVASERLFNQTPESAVQNRFATLPKLQDLPDRWRFLTTDAPSASEYRDDMTSLEYYAYIHALARRVITSDGYRDPNTGVISNRAWKELVDGGILAASFGDRDPATRQEEIMTVARMLSYYDLSLGLTFGITTGLAIMPLKRFGTQEQQEKYLGKIRDGERMGLAITEWDKSGSSALVMDSNYTINPDGTVTLDFSKHFQGLSGMGGLIVALKNSDGSGKVALFVVDQEYIRTKLTPMRVLSGIPYGINTGRDKGKVTFNANNHLMRELDRRGVMEDFNDMFIRSRFLFVGMTIGHQERMEYEANLYATHRIIGNELQANMEDPADTLRRIRSRGIILDAIFRRVAAYTTDGNSLLHTNTTDFETEANIIKTLSALYAYESADDRVMLKGGRAYYLADPAMQGLMDIRPFRIFEGAEPMLYTKIGHDYAFRNRDDDRGLFDRFTAYQNLDEVSRESLETIVGIRKLTKVQEKIMGEIVSRGFALGCLDPKDYDPDDFLDAKNLLNAEIQKLATDFAYASVAA